MEEKRRIKNGKTGRRRRRVDSEMEGRGAEEEKGLQMYVYIEYQLPYFKAKRSWLSAAIRGSRVISVCCINILRLLLLRKNTRHTSSKFLIINF